MSNETAIIAVDLQNDFIRGSLAVPGGLTVVGLVNEFARQNPTFWRFASMDWHPHSWEPSPELDKHWLSYGMHCVRGTWGAEFDPSFDHGRYQVVRKGQQSAGESAFDGVDQEGFTLDALLKRCNITKIIVVGIALDVCVLATALAGKQLGYSVAVRTDLTAAITPEGAEHARRVISMAGGRII